MEHFHKMLYELQGKHKRNLANICLREFPFKYKTMLFGFANINYRAPEEMIMKIRISSPFEPVEEKYAQVVETYLLQRVFPAIKELHKSFYNINKEVFAKARFTCQEADARVVRRSGIEYIPDENVFILYVTIDFPLINGVAVSQKPSENAIKGILSTVNAVLESIEQVEIDACIHTNRIQKQIRDFLIKHEFCAFVANGSILPREKDTEAPLLNAIPFLAPKSLEITIHLDDGTFVTGMGIKCGITVITGGGYSGKTTLLNALQEGIYDKLPGDGREYVITVGNALQTFAEDGRYVSNLDLSPFFKELPGGDVAKFSTDHASGSISQAANIIEAICGGCKLLLVDEDKSATNLMIRDEVMRQLIKQEPIIPFTDRINEFYQLHGVSSIIVIGGCSEFLFRADRVIMMENYTALDVTNDITNYISPYRLREMPPKKMQNCRRIIPRATNHEFLYFKNISTTEQRKLVLDDYSVDITSLSTIKNLNQMNTLSSMLGWLLCDQQANNDELIDKIFVILNQLFTGEKAFNVFNINERRFYEEVRPIDAYSCVNRVRGVMFTADED